MGVGTKAGADGCKGSLYERKANSLDLPRQRRFGTRQEDNKKSVGQIIMETSDFALRVMLKLSYRWKDSSKLSKLFEGVDTLQGEQGCGSS